MVSFVWSTKADINLHLFGKSWFNLNERCKPIRRHINVCGHQYSINLIISLCNNVGHPQAHCISVLHPLYSVWLSIHPSLPFAHSSCSVFMQYIRWDWQGKTRVNRLNRWWPPLGPVTIPAFPDDAVSQTHVSICSENRMWLDWKCRKINLEWSLLHLVF